MINKAIINAQNKSISSLKDVINKFITSSNKTRVVPLAIPTGWGKTRIALQAVLRAKYRVVPTIIIWPQNQGHINKIWKRQTDWCRNQKKACADLCKCATDKPVIKKLVKEKKRADSVFNSHSAESFKGTFYYVNNNFGGVGTKLDKLKGAFVFIIDEWHNKNLLAKFEAYKKLDSGNPEQFWRDRLLGKNSNRKILVLLISATPIGATTDMDSLHIDDDEIFEKQITNAIHTFKALTMVGNRRIKYNLYTIYPELINREAKRLFREQQRLSTTENIITGKSKWIDNYVAVSKKMYENYPKSPVNPSQIYQLESLALSGPVCGIKSAFENSDGLKIYFTNHFLNQNNSMKLATLLTLIKKYQHKKFVVFCHYIDVAKNVEYFLKKKNINAHYIDTTSVENKNKFDKFNDGKDKSVRIIILTDKFSQGIDLHESAAWLIHFELSWNPIRIMQRFGRVWRIQKENRELTKPVAFHIPHSFSSEEEMLARLKRRWDILIEKSKGDTEDSTYINLAPITYNVALGYRCSPAPGDMS